jgi:hypothetical protein
MLSYLDPWDVLHEVLCSGRDEGWSFETSWLEAMRQFHH